MVVLGVEYLRHNLRKLLVLHRHSIVAAVKFTHVDYLRRTRLPESERVHKPRIISRNRHIVRLADNRVIVHMAEFHTVVLPVFLNSAVVVDLHAVLRAFYLPHVAVLKPRVGHLYLIAVNYFLSEKSVFVTYAAAERGQLQSRKRIKKARRKSAQTSVTKTRVIFHILNIGQVNAKIIHCRTVNVCLHYIHNVVTQRSAHKKLERKIIKLLLVTLFKLVTRFCPLFHYLVANRHCASLVHLSRSRVIHSLCKITPKLAAYCAFYLLFLLFELRI